MVQGIAGFDQPVRKGIKFSDPAEKEPAETKLEENAEAKKKKKQLPRRHTGYAFDHPGFESFHADEVIAPVMVGMDQASKPFWHANLACTG